MRLKNLTNPIYSDLEAVNQILTKTLQDSQPPELKDVMLHLNASKGKQVRASLTLLCYRIACKNSLQPLNQNQKIVHAIAAGIELIHAASLIHDDIIDASPIRREQASIFGKWGTNKAIISGVYAYAKALELITNTGNFSTMPSISETVRLLCEGEFSQMASRGKIERTENYLEMVRKKTAVLFASACYCGALLGGSSEFAERCKSFGEALGMVFQITDDYLDLFGDGTSLKKLPGQDILAGEFTLPLHLLLDSISSDLRKEILNLIAARDMSVLSLIQANLNSKVQDKTRQILQHHLDAATRLIDTMPKGKSLDVLSQITETIASRCFGEALQTL